MARGKRRIKNQLELFPTGEQLRDEGIKRSEDHANRVLPGWSEQAYKFLMQYIEDHPGEFQMEQVRIASEGVVPIPPNTSAWGAIPVRAAKAGKIKKVGLKAVERAVAHKRIHPVWIKVKRA